MKKILISQKHVVLVDDIDYLMISKYKWTVKQKPNKRYYALRSSQKSDNLSIWQKTTISMHQQILNFPKKQIDHINHNGLDNRRSNLRICDQTQNNANSRLPITNTSGYRGICFCKQTRQFMAQINYHKHRIYLGRFNDPIDAAKAYDQKAIELFKEFASLNFPLRGIEK